MKDTVEASTTRLRQMVSKVSTKELTLTEMHSLAHESRGEVEKAKKLDAEKLLTAWVELNEAIEKSYRVANLGFTLQ